MARPGTWMPPASPRPGGEGTCRQGPRTTPRTSCGGLLGLNAGPSIFVIPRLPLPLLIATLALFSQAYIGSSINVNLSSSNGTQSECTYLKGEHVTPGQREPLTRRRRRRRLEKGKCDGLALHKETALMSLESWTAFPRTLCATRDLILPPPSSSSSLG